MNLCFLVKHGLLAGNRGGGKCVCEGSSSALPSTSVGESKRQVESTGKGKSQAERVWGL